MSKPTARKTRKTVRARKPRATASPTPCALVSRGDASMLAELMDERNVTQYDTAMIERPRRHYLGQTLTLGAGIAMTTLFSAVSTFR